MPSLNHGPPRLCGLWLILLLALAAGPAGAKQILGQDVPMASGIREPLVQDLPGIMESTRLVVGTVLAIPYYFFGPRGKEQGFDYRLLKGYGKYLNRGRSRRQLPVVVVFLPMTYEKLIPALTQGYVDVVAAGLTITPERQKRVEFTRPYLSGVNEVVAANKVVSGLAKLEDLSGRKVYVRPSSSYHQSLLRLNARLRAQGRAPVKIVPADETLSTGDILQMVNAGIVGLTVADAQMAGYWAQVLPNLRVHDKLVLRQGGQLAMMVRKDSPKLKASLDKFLLTHQKGTLIGNVLFNRYFKGTRWIKNPLDEQIRRRLGRYLKWFQKYGGQYDIDWLLLVAQALRESGLDPDKKSKTGAIGLMQVLPSLAHDQRLDIKSLRTPQYNIQAGAQYLDFLRHKYFDAPGISPDDRLRFALAAYNAGPARIARVRRQAVKMGYDPNVWFQNCEVAALKHIGRQPVEYVRDINKYYVALKLAYRQYFKQQELKEKKKPAAQAS